MNITPSSQPSRAKDAVSIRLKRWLAYTACYLLLTLTISTTAFAIDDTSYITTQKDKKNFALSAGGKSAPLYLSAEEYPGVLKVAKHLQADIKQVTQTEPVLAVGNKPAGKEIIIIGTLGHSPLIDQLVKSKSLNVKDLSGKWETFVVQVVEKPMRGVSKALVIVGSDKRGTIYGMYDLSAQIGVSPWNWWADVPAKQQANLYVVPGRHTQGEPAVKYRGFFINDEAPALSGWARKTFGGFNHKFYDRVFELLLRMKGNYLWPAMWGSAFYDDDKQNPVLADEYGVVIGTSHHEPLMRAHDEWRRSGSGPWNYNTNKTKLQEFWRESIKERAKYESIVTIGMRGDGDEPMTEGANIALLEGIVKDQRQILSEVTGKKPEQIPQMWALYKEVQDYYDKGMRVPDDVTLLLCDDNWGNIRKLPKVGEKQHAGGYGIYYHYDYVGGPRNYKWLNTNPISRIWEQMHLAYQHKADRVWIVNVGDIKPMEFPLEFFLDYAWAPEKWPAERLEEYTRLWAEKQFGPEHAPTIADILAKYAKFNSRRKPEMLSPDTYSLLHYREAERVVEDYNNLLAEAERINQALPSQYRDAYFQLVLHPVQAGANLNDLYVTVAKNRLYAQQGRAATNALAARARELFAKDAAISAHYNKGIAGGKWEHMMDQTHIGYTYWQQPEKDVMPEVKEIQPKAAAEMGVAVEGSEAWWPQEKKEAVLPTFSPFGAQGHFVEIFNRGKEAFQYSIETGAPWLQVTPMQGRVETEQRVRVTVDWQQAPAGKRRVPITITGPNGAKVVVQAQIDKPAALQPGQVKGFVQNQNYVSMEAPHFTRAVDAGPVKWLLIPDLGRTGSAMTPTPVTAPSQTPGGNSPRLEYMVHLLDSGEVTIKVYLSPTLNFHSTQGLRYAVSVDDAAPQIVNMHQGENQRLWEQWVGNNINITSSKHTVARPGEHVVKFWMVDSGVVLQKLVVETGEVKPSYLGPPESFRNPQANP